MQRLRLHSNKFSKAFTLTELMIVVAIIAILAAIAIPSYTKYIKDARGAEAFSNIAAIQTFQEAYFSENDQYVTAQANPTTLPQAGQREAFDGTLADWSALGRVMPDGRETFFQYEITAGTADGTVTNPATVTHGSDCTAGIGDSGFTGVTTGSLNIPITANTFWFVVTAVGDQDGDAECSLFLGVTDRPDIAIEKKLE